MKILRAFSGMLAAVMVGAALAGCSSPSGEIKVISQGKTDDGFSYTVYSNKTASLTDWDGTAESVTTPATVEKGIPVTTLGSFLFEQTTAKEITVSEGVTRIDTMAFQDSSELTAVHLPSTLREIGKRAFSGCMNLSALEIPESVTSLGAYAFCGTAIQTVTVPAGVTVLPEGVFDHCTKLVSVTFAGDTLNEMGSYAFAQCAALSSIALPNGIQKIMSWTFGECRALTEIEFPATLSHIYDRAFTNCKALTRIRFRGTKEQWKAVAITSQAFSSIPDDIVFDQ